MCSNTFNCLIVIVIYHDILLSYGILLITAAMTILGMLITCIVIIQGLFCDAKLCIFREPEERPGIGK